MSTEASSPALPRSAGALLAAERERQGLSRADIAQRLHFSVSQIEALETGDFASLAGGPFLKGFVRNYARALGVDPEPLASLLSRDVPSPSPPNLVVPNQGIRFDPVSQRWSPVAVRAGIAAVALLVVSVGVLYWWLNVYPAAPATVSAPASAPDTRASELPGMAPAIPPETAPAATPAVAPPTPQTEVPRAPQETIAPPSPAAERTAPTPAGLARVQIKSQERTWIEIIDGTGERIVSRHVEPDRPGDFLGRPPLRVAIGNASGTQLSFNGRLVDLTPHTRAAVARLTLE